MADLWQLQPMAGSPFSHLGKAEAVAYDPRAPLDEVADATAQVGSKYAGGITETPDLMGMIRDWAELMQVEKQASRFMAKSLRGKQATVDHAKARVNPLVQTMGAGGQYLPKPGIPFAALRQLAQRIELVQAIHRTRRRQVMAFGEPSTMPDELGWQIVHADTGRKLDPADQEREAEYFAWLAQTVRSGGLEHDPIKRRRLARQDFRMLLGQTLDDSLTLDHVVYETVAAQAGNTTGLDCWFIRDGATFYLCDTFGDPDADDRFMVQSIDNGAAGVEGFNYDEVALFQRNLSTEIERCGYATSELESCLETLSNFIQAVAHTREGIDNNAIPRGILVLSGAYNPTQMKAFEQAWSAKIRGAQNAFTLPMLFSRGQQGAAQFVGTGPEFSEMHFARWISLQTSVGCAIYGMDPKEIAMEGFAVETSPLGGDDTAERLTASRDKGLKPWLTDFRGFYSSFILGRFWDKAQLKFNGLNDGDPSQRRADRQTVMTINEKREALGMPPYPIDWIGHLPADSVLMGQEFQRLSAVMTVNEGRKVFGGMDPHPDPIVGNAPLNPSLGVSYQSGLAGFDPFLNGDGGGDGGDADGAGDQPDADGAGAEVDPGADASPGSDGSGVDSEGGAGASPSAKDGQASLVSKRLESMRPGDDKP